MIHVVICGAGQVGFNIARYLSHYDTQITIVDHSEELINEITNTLDVQGICGFASHPEVLERAGLDSADVLIAVTQVDEVNMIACEVAHASFNTKTKIARVRSQAYLDPKWNHIFGDNNLAVDVVISPEAEIAKSISYSLTVPGAFLVIPFAEEKVKVVGVKCTINTPIVNTPLSHITSLFPSAEMTILGIIRGNTYIIPNEDERLLKDDEIYFCAATESIPHAMAAFGATSSQSRRLLILGGGQVGLTLAQQVEKNHPSISIRIIEQDKKRAEHISQVLSDTIVLCGNALENDILQEANVNNTDIVVAITADDRVNTLASILAKHQGAKHVQALINHRSYTPLVTSLGVDAIINPRAITVSKILQYVRRGRVFNVRSLREGFGEIIELEVHESSPFVGLSIEEVNKPNEIIIGAIIRKDEVIHPHPSSILQTGDHIVMMVASKAISEIEELLAEQITHY